MLQKAVNDKNDLKKQKPPASSDLSKRLIFKDQPPAPSFKAHSRKQSLSNTAGSFGTFGPSSGKVSNGFERFERFGREDSFEQEKNHLQRGKLGQLGQGGRRFERRELSPSAIVKDCKEYDEFFNEYLQKKKVVDRVRTKGAQISKLYDLNNLQKK